MAQTTGAISFADVKAEISTNGSSWTNVSGTTTGAEIDGGDRQAEATHTADGDTPVVTSGKREALTVTINGLYSESGSEAFETLRALYEADTPIYVRWSPKGGTTGQYQFATPSAVPMTQFMYPVGEVGSADAVPFNFAVLTPYLNKAVVA